MWLHDFEPKAIKDFFLNKSHIYTLNNLIRNDNYQSIIIHGCEGNGMNFATKTLLYDLFKLK